MISTALVINGADYIAFAIGLHLSTLLAMLCFIVFNHPSRIQLSNLLTCSCRGLNPMSEFISVYLLGRREYVFGMSHSMTGTIIYVMPPQPRAPSGTMERPGSSYSSSYSPSYSSSTVRAQTVASRGYHPHTFCLLLNPSMFSSMP